MFSHISPLHVMHIQFTLIHLPHIYFSHVSPIALGSKYPFKFQNGISKKAATLSFPLPPRDHPLLPFIRKWAVVLSLLLGASLFPKKKIDTDENTTCSAQTTVLVPNSFKSGTSTGACSELERRRCSFWTWSVLVLNLIVASSLVKSPVLELYLTKKNSSLEQTPAPVLNLKETGACSELDRCLFWTCRCLFWTWYRRCLFCTCIKYRKVWVC